MTFETARRENGLHITNVVHRFDGRSGLIRAGNETAHRQKGEQNPSQRAWMERHRASGRLLGENEPSAERSDKSDGSVLW
jgi:hypothetical protein